MIKDTSEKIKRFFCEHYVFLFVGVLIGTLTYFMLMAGELVNNYDGIWHPSNFIAGDWEIALGRPFERYCDRLRFGIVSSSLNSVMVFLLIAIGDALILERFGNKNKAVSYLFLVLTIANPMVGELLSYYYLAVNYECAWLFSVIAFAVLPGEPGKGRAFWGSAAFGGLMLAFSLSFYQAYIGVTCTLIAAYVMKLLKEQAEKSRVLRYIGLAFSEIVFGGIFYLGIVKLMLLRAGTQLADYKGANSVSLLAILRGLPVSIAECYRQFLHFVFSRHFDTGLEFAPLMAILVVLGAAAAVLTTAWRIFRTKRIYAAFYVLMALLLPVASCSVIIIAVGNTVTGLMAMGILLAFLMICLLAEPGSAGRKVCIASLCIAGWFMLHQVQNDQLAMKEGMNATTVLAEDMIEDLYDHGYPDQADTVAFVGRAAENPRFSQSEAFRLANEYAQFGKWSTDPRNNRATWYGITTKLCGTNINLCPDDRYAALIDRSDVAAMPDYPAEGSIDMIDGVIVVKVSGLYR